MEWVVPPWLYSATFHHQQAWRTTFFGLSFQHSAFVCLSQAPGLQLMQRSKHLSCLQNVENPDHLSALCMLPMELRHCNLHSFYSNVGCGSQRSWGQSRTPVMHHVDWPIPSTMSKPTILHQIKSQKKQNGQWTNFKSNAPEASSLSVLLTKDLESWLLSPSCL